MNKDKLLQLKTLIDELLLEPVAVKEVTEITTSTGHKWTKTATHWKDESSGLLWELEPRGNMTWGDAMKFCKDNNVKMPTRHQWSEAFGHGIQEVLEDTNEKFFWSASSVSGGRNYAWVFLGDGGYVSYNVRFNTFSVRCLGR